MKEVPTMTRIRDVVQEALLTGYLTLEAENQLRQLLTTRYDTEDLNAFMKLQEAAMGGEVRQQSREDSKHEDAVPNVTVHAAPAQA
ncbi:MAG: hypothetical protein KME29_02430 [Calothrix sp. FI2-JRJ7]|jgi:hypothetical protein|nr:hypothetical protein [Calothrix sp. FI2-JRJ7]